MNKVVLFDIDYTLFDTDTFKKSGLTNYSLYKDVEDMLGKLADKAEIGIFSTGENDFQREKLKQTLISDHFKEKNVHIFLNKDDNIGNVLHKYQNSTVFLVDDKLNILSQAQDINPNVKTFWMKRGPYAENEENIEGFRPDATIANLSEIIPFILNS